MSRLPVLLIVCGGLVGAAFAAPVPKPLPPYFPTTVGAKWTYKFPNGDVVLTVSKVEGTGAKRVVSVGQVRADGATTPDRKVEVSDAGLLQVESVVVVLAFGGGPKPADEWKVEDPPLRLLNLPSKPGQTWKGRAGSDAPVEFTAGKPEEVTVPAGKFVAIPVDQVVTIQGREPLRFRYWYGQGVGAVKWMTADRQEVVLKAFSPD